MKYNRVEQNETEVLLLPFIPDVEGSFLEDPIPLVRELDQDLFMPWQARAQVLHISSSSLCPPCALSSAMVQWLC